MSQRHTFLFGAVLAVTGAAVATDHYRHGAPTAHPSPQPHDKAASAPAAAPAPRATTPDHGTKGGIIELAPCSANMDGLMAAPLSTAKPAPDPKPADATVTDHAPAPKPAPAPRPAPATPQQDEIIEFAPCAAAF